MCGIIGYIGVNNPVDILINGLKNLEYRGYDSAGIALKNDSGFQVIKSVGGISNLEDKISKMKLIAATMGIAHTRWATHGECSERNAHPHTVGKITLVHNGIIENFLELKEELEQDNVVFKSETDTEVITALINKYYDGDIFTALKCATDKVKGSYALAILVDGDNKIYAVRKGSPLVLGISEDGYFVASDTLAIIDYTNKYILLDEDEIAVLNFDSYSVFKDGKKIDKEVLVNNTLKNDRSKCGYDHYMLKEIMEEPVVLEKTLKPFIDDISKLPDLTAYKKIHIVACGSALYAGMIGKSLLEEKSDVEVVCEVASEYRYKKVFYNEKTLVILVSQSGETADTIAALRKAKENNVDTLAIVNVVGSTIARESDKQIFIEAGPEIAVATTKAYILQVAIFALLSYRLASSKKLLEDNIEEELKLIPKILKSVLERENDYIKIAEKICKCHDVFFIGRGVDYAISLEGSLKLKEVSYIHSEAYQAGELKHGTISLIDKGTVVFAIVTDPNIALKTISNINEVKARGAFVIDISNDSYASYDIDIKIPKVSSFLQPILAVCVLQLIAYHTARLRNCEIDKPKNLAKSVTVE